MLKKVMTASLSGIDADFIIVEADIQAGIPVMNLVGLADTTIKEAKERVRAAISNSGYEFPKRRITVNLSPAGVPKEGTHFDLPIAVGIIGTIYERINNKGFGFIGELSLDGTVKSVRGALPLVMKLREEGVKKVVLPKGNAQEVSLLEDIDLYPVDSLGECMDFLVGDAEILPYKSKETQYKNEADIMDFSDVEGQENVKRALMIAAAGNHGVLMVGSPGCGKTMMAKRIPYILPELNYDELIEVTKVHSVAGNNTDEFIASRKRPFRAPHYSITKTALIGGGNIPRPGEVSLAHNGVLFLDEFSEFDPAVIELLRQPIEEGRIRINRARAQVEYPCDLMLIAAANPCKCGFYGDEQHLCTCTTRQLESYFAKFSGPVLDRIDMHIMVRAVEEDVLKNSRDNVSTAEMKEQVLKAVAVQKQRYKDTKIIFNSRLEDSAIKSFCVMRPDAEGLLRSAYNKLGLSMRSYNKVIKVARTIADIDGADMIEAPHIAEALQYRSIEYFCRR